MQDVELMHMRYALESAVFALGAMSRILPNVKESHQLGLYYLKDLRKHLEAINTIPRKVERALIHRTFFTLIIFWILATLVLIVFLCNKAA